MQATPSHDRFDERRSIRPLVLMICFSWGLTCGFIFHLFSGSSKPDKTAAATKKETTQKDNDSAAKSSSKPLEQEPVVTRAKEIAAPSFEISAPQNDRDNSASIKLTQVTPHPPTFELNTGFGLSGKTARRPSIPKEPTSNAATAFPAARSSGDNSSKKTTGFEPELDDL